MAIKALFPEGTTSITLAPLYQWDYGQELEIEAASLPSLIEVHFACNGMNEAVVHTCSSVNNIATVAIPDRCLEQSNEITAWVYEIDGTAGRTIYSIKIPITARTRPARSESIPQSVRDTYTQLITEVNDLLEALQGGTVNVGYATKAGTADAATKATTADTATNAVTAGTASTAISATKDSAGNIIADTYMKIPKDYTAYSDNTILAYGLYHFYALINDSSAGMKSGCSFLVDLGVANTPGYVYSPVMSIGSSLYRLKFEVSGTNGYKYAATEICSNGSTGFVFSTAEDGFAYYKKVD